MATYEKHHCWSVLLRLFHWMFALSIVFLVTTGFYINNPWTNTMIEGSASFPMATMRYIHFIAAYVLTSAVLIRLFLYIFGNAQERIWDILPITKRNLNNLKMTLLQYSYISDEHDERLGQLGEHLDLSDASQLSLSDRWLGIDVMLKLDRPSGIWAFPVETVSQSEAGFELVHQSVCVQPHWLVRGDAEGRWHVTIEMTASCEQHAETVDEQQVIQL